MSPLSSSNAVSLTPQQRIIAVLTDPTNHTLSILALCRQAGFANAKPWYQAMKQADFRATVTALGGRLPYDPVPSPFPESGPFRHLSQRRLWHVLQDPATRTLPKREICQRAGYPDPDVWSAAVHDPQFYNAVQQLGIPLRPRPAADVASASGFTTLSQQRFWTLLQDPTNRLLSRDELCQKAGYTSDTSWYTALRDEHFRAWVASIGIPYTRIPHRASRLPRGAIALATDLEAEWALDRIDVRRLSLDYAKHKNASQYTIDFSFLHNLELKAVLKRYFRARLGTKWSAYTLVVNLPTFKPIFQELERRYPDLASFAPLTRAMFAPMLELTGWVDSAGRYQPMTPEHRLRTVILFNAMFRYMQQHQWPEAPRVALIYDEDFPQRIRHTPKPNPDTIMEQLHAHLERLPPYDRHLVQIMSVMGLRCVDALHLTEDCLEYDAAGDPRVRWYNVKMKRDVRPLPVTHEVAAAIIAQRELVYDVPVVHEQRYLFRTATGLYSYNLFYAHLNRLAQEIPIRGIDGQIFHFRPHRFRHTVGTEMINNGMGIADVMTYLDHQSAEMTRNYALIYDDTLKQKFKAVVMSGRAVGGIALRSLREQIAHGDESELDWVVANLRKLSLPWGQCLHHAKAPKCPYGQNACFTKDNGPCHKLVTTPEHIPVIRATLADLRQSHQSAHDHGWEMYADDLAAQISGMEHVLQELALPADQRPKNRGGRS